MTTATESREAWTPGLWQIDAPAYFADCEHVSHSMLEDFRRSALLYASRYIHKTLPRDEPTPAMVLGTAVHALVFEPERFASLVAVQPDCDGRTKEGKAIKAAFKESSNGKTIITEEQFATANVMAASIRQHTMAKELLSADGKNERVIRWTDPETGLACKGKIDRLLDAGILLDLKTTADPNPAEWGRKSASYGAHRQSALYLDGAEKAVGLVNGDFYHILCGSEPPHEVAVVSLRAKAIDLGHEQNAALLARLARRLAVGDWRSDWSDEIVSVDLPRWCFTEE